MGHLVTERDQAGQAGPASHKSMLAGPDVVVVLYVLCDGTQDDLLHNLLTTTLITSAGQTMKRSPEQNHFLKFIFHYFNPELSLSKTN